MIVDEPAELLKRKQEIDALAAGSFTQTNRWLVDAVELLLRMMMELRQNLKDQGILR